MAIYKKPVTGSQDGFNKASLKGIPAVWRVQDKLVVKDGALEEDLDACEFQKVMREGVLVIKEDFETIRNRVRA